jgi:predicted RNA-binding Zn ribbon-like protein
MTMSDDTTSGGPPAPLASSFLYVGEALALDLVNTEAVVRRRPVDLLAPDGAWVAWWRETAGRYPAAVASLAESNREATPELLPAVIRLRGALRELFGAVADGASLPAVALDELNRVLAATRDAIANDADGRAVARLVPAGREVDGPMAAVARSAFELLTGAEPDRIHRCANPHCVMIFHDTTKSATRRWCSLACRNRQRSTTRYFVRKGRTEG